MKIDYDKMPKGTAKDTYPYLWETVISEFPGLSEDQHEKIMWLVTGTCQECFNEARSHPLCGWD